MATAFGPGNMLPKEVNILHINSDVDKSSLSQHHTLGIKATQASPGDHIHDGRTSKKIELANLIGVSIAYVPEGGTLGTQPTFSGAPLITGSYTRWGNMCHFQIDVDMDNITDFGTGQYYLTLPFVSEFSYQFASGCLHDISTGRDYPVHAHVTAGSDQIVLKTMDAQGNIAYNVAFTSTVPVTLSTADNFHVSGIYEIQQA